MMSSGKPQPRTCCTATLFKRPAMARTKGNGRSMEGFSIAEGKEMLIVSTYPY
jgi:hypothetical protein